MFRPLRGHHQGAIYKGIQVEYIVSKLLVCRVQIQKGKPDTRTAHEGPEGTKRYSSALSLTWALNGNW
jgi:hypothetical protein